MAKKKGKPPEKPAGEEPSAPQNRANVRPERMQHNPVQETEAGLRARVRQPIMRVDQEKGHEWRRTCRTFAKNGYYFSNEREWQYKALCWEVPDIKPGTTKFWRVCLRGQPQEQPDFATLDEAMAWGRLEVENRLAAGWNPYALVHIKASEAKVE